jgi:SAM-dependent methyltransferase
LPLPDTSRLSAAAGRTLVRQFRESGVTREFVAGATQGSDDLRGPLTAARHARFNDDAATLITRLFFCGESVEASGVHRWGLEAGVLEHEGGGRVRAPYHLRIVRGLYLFSDYLTDDRDAVMGAGETTAVLYESGRRNERRGRALDLGCGAGTLALLLATQSGEVVGTDINPRAVEIARFNAFINDIRNVEFRAGDLYATVAGEQFDLILSQPPYFPAPPGASQTFLHGGLRGDELALRIIDEAARHLSAQGRAIVFATWPEDHKTEARPGARLLEIVSNRQSLTVIEHAGDSAGWAARFEAPAGSWGHVRSWRIDQMVEAEELLRKGWTGRRLALPAGAEAFEEDGERFLRFPPTALVEVTQVDEETWKTLRSVGAGSGGEDPKTIEWALRKGVLIPLH